MCHELRLVIDLDLFLILQYSFTDNNANNYKYFLVLTVVFVMIILSSFFVKVSFHTFSMCFEKSVSIKGCTYLLKVLAWTEVFQPLFRKPWLEYTIIFQ